MVATPLTPTTRYIPPGVTRYYWVASIANKNSPTRSELDAGTDLTSEIHALAGFSYSNSPVETPDLGSTFTSKIPGLNAADDSSLTFYMSKTGTDVRTLLTKGLAGFVVIFSEGDAPGNVMDVYPVSISGAPKQRSMADPSTIMVNFTITSIPVENIAVP
jgi:hypothetical protein